MTNRATLTSSTSETSMPDSLDTSMLIRDSLAFARWAAWTTSSTIAAAGCPPSRPVHSVAGLLVSRVGVHDFPDQAMTHHIRTGQLRNVNVVDVLENVDRRPQPRPCTTRQVDLGDIAGDDHLGP